MRYSFSDLVAAGDIQHLLVSFHSISGVTAEILDPDSPNRVASSDQGPRDALQQEFPQPRGAIDHSLEEIVPQAGERSTSRFEYPGGLFKFAHAIRVEDQDIATLCLGPVYLAQPADDMHRLQAQGLGMDGAISPEALRQAPVISEAQAERYMKFLVQLVQRQAENGLTNLRRTGKFLAAQEYLEEQQHRHDELEARLRERTAELERVNAALQESEQRFRVALLDTPVVVFNQDLDLRYTWIYNPRNYADQPVVGKTDAELFSHDEALLLTALKKRVIAAGLLTREEVSMTVGSRALFYDMTLDPLYNSDGEVIGVTCAATNITERKQSEEELRRRLAESEGLQKIAKGLLQKIGLDEVLEIVCAEAMQLTGAEGSAVLLLDENGWLRLTQRAGQPVYKLDRLPVDKSIAGQAIQSDSLVWVKRQESEPEEADDQWQGLPWTPGLRSMLSVPLKVDTQPIGVLNILNKPGDLTQEDIRIIDLFADQAAIIIEHVRLQHQAEQLAILEERQRLARELHDSVTQALYSVTLYADAARMAYSARQWEALERNLQEVGSMAREAMYDMRLLIFELRPFMLEKEGLVSALRARLAAVEGRAGLTTELIVDGERRLPVMIEEEIYRIAQEGLNNVVKHARASAVQIHLQYDIDMVSLELSDNGQGFDPAIAGSSGGVGLRGIQERVQRVGGNLEIESAAGQGARFTVKIPVNELDLHKSNTTVER